jgi:hypothetical protein
MCYTDIDKTYQILLTSQGAEVIADNFKAYTTRIETPYSVWRSISRGEISGSEALFQRQYKVLGDFGLMLKWDELFGASVPQKKTADLRQSESNMSVLLMPWMVIWITFAINPVIGGVLGVFAAAFVPMLWLKFNPVIYERISIFVIASLSVLVLQGANVQFIVPLSYLMFGFLWTAGAFMKIPLTAYYSMTGYGGEKALSNRIFMQTNRVLTAAWGVLYLVTPIWTYVLMGTGLSPYTGLINSVCPAVMGVFTVWFQKWYPARRGRGAA